MRIKKVILLILLFTNYSFASTNDNAQVTFNVEVIPRCYLNVPSSLNVGQLYIENKLRVNKSFTVHVACEDVVSSSLLTKFNGNLIDKKNIDLNLGGNSKAMILFNGKAINLDNSTGSCSGTSDRECTYSFASFIGSNTKFGNFMGSINFTLKIN